MFHPPIFIILRDSSCTPCAPQRRSDARMGVMIALLAALWQSSPTLAQEKHQAESSGAAPLAPREPPPPPVGQSPAPPPNIVPLPPQFIPGQQSPQRAQNGRPGPQSVYGRPNGTYFTAPYPPAVAFDPQVFELYSQDYQAYPYVHSPYGQQTSENMQTDMQQENSQYVASGSNLTIYTCRLLDGNGSCSIAGPIGIVSGAVCNCRFGGRVQYGAISLAAPHFYTCLVADSGETCQVPGPAGVASGTDCFCALPGQVE